MSRIIGGIARSLVLEVPRGQDVRPTGARARKALFDSLAPWTGRTVVDLFSGTGALGLEAASRGAAEVFLVENVAKHCRLIETNRDKVLKAGTTASIRVIRGDALRAPALLANLAGAIDVLFMDPPYEQTAAVVAAITRDPAFAAWAANAVIVLEVPPDRARRPAPDDLGLWNAIKERKLGENIFLFAKLSPKTGDGTFGN